MCVGIMTWLELLTLSFCDKPTTCRWVETGTKVGRLDWLTYYLLTYFLLPGAGGGLVLTYISHTHAHTHPFNGPLSGTTRVSRYQRGKTNPDFTEAKSRWVAVASAGPYASLQLAPDRLPYQHPPLLPFLPPNQQRQSTEDISVRIFS